MSKRSDIIDGRDASTAKYGIVYTEVLGWVDLGHAQGTDIRTLLGLMAQGESSGKEFYDIRYSQGMTSPFGLLRPVSKAEALKRWDYYGEIGSWKNETFLPLLFPDPEKFPHSRPRKGLLPPFMRTVVPYNDFLSGNVILPQHDGSFVILGAGNGRMGL
ncbi:hypothetical protein N5923_16080 [Erwiniaceae bacterium BAC15a-03b]|uniref:Uncharacterized protein n=1 Tax=Winslowiella arboricola TaxID=2978220 RepID=A0A9J6PVZ5_9GAMM|nr:hypothetical protein [Winslowiella arboricola]MCU5774457.1 hypothetical protein [Winslowiella arboricola]MCU5779004.1 hypothetical protein [Winslowiella arboricola]